MELSSFLSDFENLPKNVQQQVLDYIDFLKLKYSMKENKKTNEENTQKGFSFDWKGGLSELKNDYTSVELQHKINEMR